MTNKQMRIVKERLLSARLQLTQKIQRNRYNLHDSEDRQVRDSGDRIVECNRNNYLQGESALLYLNLRLIEDALERIESGIYGHCSECGKSIGKKRLSVVPWAHLCINCQERKEMSNVPYGQKLPFLISKKSHQSRTRRVHQ